MRPPSNLTSFMIIPSRGCLAAQGADCHRAPVQIQRPAKVEPEHGLDPPAFYLLCEYIIHSIERPAPLVKPSHRPDSEASEAIRMGYDDIPSAARKPASRSPPQWRGEGPGTPR